MSGGFSGEERDYSELNIPPTLSTRPRPTGSPGPSLCLVFCFLGPAFALASNTGGQPESARADEGHRWGFAAVLGAAGVGEEERGAGATVAAGSQLELRRC